VLEKFLLLQESIQLVSRSPRRKDILSKIFREVEVVDFDFDEKISEGLNLLEIPSFLAAKKMKQFLNSEKPKMDTIITADTIVFYPETATILGKPKNLVEADKMLRYHFGREQLVVTSVCYFNSKKNIKKIITDEAIVKFKEYQKIPEEIIHKYLQLLPPIGPLDKAGAYGIQEEEVFNYMIESVSGDINTVIGFPLEKFVSIIINSSSR